jgi:FtsH-binding integral membrane protein
VNSYQPPASPAQLGVRPAPALVQQLLVGAFGWMFAGLLLTAGVSYLVSTSTAITEGVITVWLPLLIGQLVLAIVIQGAINRLSPMVSLVLFFIYAATMGLTIGVIVQLYTTESVAAAFLSSSAMFGGAAFYGAVTKRDLTGIGGIVVMSLIGLIVASVVNIFLQSTQMGWIISIVGVLIFVVLTAWDVQRITTGQYAAMVKSAERASVLAALHLYLDFVNLFLFLLRIFGGSRS